ncbi:uncharacterized protein LOC124630781 isoform X1 [Helicoverpa zea]|uniref:uncharacterized protein LOC124630781 isoform X1 n=1 Tax=Helicoverpa zea TaxID=7113 RepID=UPI001F599B00|nr:uncharacterized protein LOC124630781 isoform X1 [Helicoverpa zea]
MSLFNQEELAMIAIALDEEEADDQEDHKQAKKRIWVCELGEDRETLGEFHTLCQKLTPIFFSVPDGTRQGRFPGNVWIALYSSHISSYHFQVEECEEEEIIIESEDDDEDNAEGGDDRSITPTPIQDFGANVVYTEGPQATDFLRVKAMEAECYTDVSDADTDEEGN